jgi:hypothetical protein
MATWRCDERFLCELYLEGGFHRELVLEMRPFITKISAVRNEVFANATNGKRRDQWVWMKRFERMVVDAIGPEAKFLPDDEEKTRGKRAGNEVSGSDDGILVVE